MRKVIVEKSSLSVTNVEVSTRYALVGDRTISTAGNLRRFGREAGNNPVLGVLKSNVIAGTLLRLGGLLLLGSSVQGFESHRGPGAKLLKETEPTGNVNKGTLLQSSNGDSVAAESTPESDVGRRQRVSDNERTQEKVGVNALENGVESLEIEGGQRIQLRDPLIFL
jgi:hypothetical protein